MFMIHGDDYKYVSTDYRSQEPVDQLVAHSSSYGRNNKHGGGLLINDGFVFTSHGSDVTPSYYTEWRARALTATNQSIP